MSAAMRVYAIGDVHGRLGLLRAAHARIAADRARTGDGRAPVIHLGDLCDRGPDSAGVIDLLLEGMERGEPWLALCGNHDRMFRDFLADDGAATLRPPDYWLSEAIGGRETLASYGLDTYGWRGGLSALRAAAREQVPERHKAFLAGLPLWHETPDLILVHAGLRPGVPLAEQSEEDLLWIRNEFLLSGHDFGRIVVHGHTPAELPEHRGTRVNLDTGAAYGGPLTVAVFEGRDVWVLTDGGRVPLRPR